MDENSFPENRARGQRAIHDGMSIAMVDGDSVTEAVPVECELMGSAEACVFATAAYTVLNNTLRAAGRGFTLPPCDKFNLPVIQTASRAKVGTEENPL